MTECTCEGRGTCDYCYRDVCVHCCGCCGICLSDNAKGLRQVNLDELEGDEPRNCSSGYCGPRYAKKTHWDDCPGYIARGYIVKSG